MGMPSYLKIKELITKGLSSISNKIDKISDSLASMSGGSSSCIRSIQRGGIKEDEFFLSFNLDSNKKGRGTFKIPLKTKIVNPEKVYVNFKNNNTNIFLGVNSVTNDTLIINYYYYNYNSSTGQNVYYDIGSFCSWEVIEFY